MLPTCLFKFLQHNRPAMIESFDIAEKELALVVIDVQKRFLVNDGIRRTAEAMLPTINRASAMFRMAGRPVVTVWYDLLVEPLTGRDPSEDPVDGLVRDESDIVVHKTEMSAFRGTGLRGILEGLGVDGIVVCGLASRFCVLSTYFGAMEFDICPYILCGGTASSVADHIGMVEAICNTATLDSIKANRAFRGIL